MLFAPVRFLQIRVTCIMDPESCAVLPTAGLVLYRAGYLLHLLEFNTDII